MAPPRKAQRDAMVQRLMDIYPGLDKRSAEDALKSSGWDLEIALDTLLSSAESNRTEPHRPALNKLFDEYRNVAPGEDPDRMYIDSTMQYLETLNIPLESINVLILSTILESPSMGEITREGFFKGWAELPATAVAQQKATINNLNKQLQQQPLLTKQDSDAIGPRIYKHTFVIALPAGTRAVPLEMAIEYWRLLFSAQSGQEWSTPTTKWLDLWVEFLNEKWKKAVNKDLWNQTLRFAQEAMADETLSFWSEDSAWPGVIDEFVGHVKQIRPATESMDTS